MEFFSYPLTAGFTSAAALTIASTQLKSLLGISGQADGFLDAIIAICKNIRETRKWDALLGFSSVAALIFMRVTYEKKFEKIDTTNFKKKINKICFFRKSESMEVSSLVLIGLLPGT